MNENNTIIDGEYVAKYFKYFLQLKNPYVVYKRSFTKVSTKTIYKKHKKIFDKIAEICTKYHIDVVKYLDFCVNKLNKSEKDIDTSLLSIDNINAYVENIQLNNMYQQIYKNILKSIKNIVSECKKLNFNSVVDYLRYLISNKTIATQYITGKISIYYFAAIPNFKKVIEQLDSISKDEFSTLYNRYEKYHSDVNLAFLKLKNIKINPIKLTNDAILKSNQ